MKTAMKTPIKRTLAAALLALPGAALAHDYTYVEGGYVSMDRGADDEGGVRLAGSAALTPTVNVFAEGADVDEYNELAAGVMMHAPLSPTIDAVGGASIERVEVGEFDDTGLGLRGGLRWTVVDNTLEINPEIRYRNLEVGDDEASTSVRVAGLYRLTPLLGAQVAVQGGDDDRFEAGLRYGF